MKLETEVMRHGRPWRQHRRRELIRQQRLRRRSARPAALRQRALLHLESRQLRAIAVDLQQHPGFLVSLNGRRTMNDASHRSSVFGSLQEEHIKFFGFVDLVEILYDPGVASFAKGSPIYIGLIQPLRSRTPVSTKKPLTVIVLVEKPAHICLYNYKLDFHRFRIFQLREARA